MTAEEKYVVLGLLMFYSMHGLANMDPTRTDMVIIHVIFVVCSKIPPHRLSGSTTDNYEKLVYIGRNIVSGHYPSFSLDLSPEVGTEQVLPKDGDRIQSPKRCGLKNKQNSVLSSRQGDG
jgi:hypothetical protein